MTAAKPNDRCVLLTGASSGIGLLTAQRLAESGYAVLAGARKPADLQKLNAMDGVTAVELDVTKLEQIAEAAELAASKNICALINNAGVALSAPVELVPAEALRQQLEINLIGPLQLIQHCLPALRENHGRIINVSSMAGRVALPLVGPYAASKHALEGLSDSLRVELRRWNIPVSLIEPGPINTPIWERSAELAEKTLEGVSAERRALYQPLIDFGREKLADAHGVSPDKVVTVIRHALESKRPKTRYPVGLQARINLTLHKLPAAWRDGLIAKAIGQ